METICNPDYHHKDFVTTHALGATHKSCAQVHELP